MKYEESLKIKTPILIDTIKRKIYIAWNKLNYKQIHSQNTTIDILEKLIESETWTISNKELTLSSYRNNKNDMSWKIIYPFKKIIFEYLNMDFPLSISWSFSEYVIQLSRTNIDIVFIRKINDKN
jgi:hypothetical protein